MTPPGGSIPFGEERTHNAFVHFVRQASFMPNVSKQLGINNNRDFYRSYLKALLPLAQQIEDLSPEGIPHPNPEYPWQDVQGIVHSPIDYRFAGLETRNNLNIIKLLRFVEACLDEIDENS